MSGLIIVFLIAIGIQALFYLLFAIAFSRTPKPTRNPSSVTVVVCAHNEETNLRTLIPLLLSQDHPDYEVIVVEDRSGDDSFDFLKEQMGKDHRLRMVRIDYLPDHMNAKKYGLTLAIKMAVNEIILLTDADCRPVSNNWITRMTEIFEEEIQFVLGYSPYFQHEGFLNLFIRFETFMTAIQYLSMAKIGMPYMGVGRNLAYRKSFFMKTGGFKNIMEITGGDDDLFVNRHASQKNTRVCVNSESIVYSVPKTTWSSYFRQKKRHLSVGKYYKKKHLAILGIFMTSFIVSWIIGMVLIFFLPFSYLITTAFLIRLMMVQISIHLVSSRLGDKFNFWQVFFLDFLYAFYYLSTGLRAMLTRNIKWTN